jgi:hypothetical protein
MYCGVLGTDSLGNHEGIDYWVLDGSERTRMFVNIDVRSPQGETIKPIISA